MRPNDLYLKEEIVTNISYQQGYHRGVRSQQNQFLMSCFGFADTDLGDYLVDFFACLLPENGKKSSRTYFKVYKV